MLRLIDIVIDCPDTLRLAEFYAELMGRPVMDGSDADWASVTCEGFDLSFQRVDDYRRPRWPKTEHPQQFHLDYLVDDFDVEGRRAVKLGATLQADRVREDGYGFRVYTDPAGHPFCLCRSARLLP